MTHYDAVLFDMDGVTVTSANAWRTLERETILPTAANGVDVEAVRALSVADSYDRLEATDSVSLNVDREGFVGLYDTYAEEVYHERADLMDGYERFVEGLRAAELAVGLVSASCRDWVEMVLDRHELHDAYDVVLSADDVDGPSKPAPTPYQQAAAELDVDPERCLVVEDSLHGIESAVAAGAYCIALRGAGNRTTDLSKADAIADDPTELRETVTDLLDRTPSVGPTSAFET